MASSNKRMKLVAKEGNAFGTNMKILVDTETKVQYMYIHEGFSGGLSVMLDQEGKPILYKG